MVIATVIIAYNKHNVPYKSTFESELANKLQHWPGHVFIPDDSKSLQPHIYSAVCKWFDTIPGVQDYRFDISCIVGDCVPGKKKFEFKVADSIS